MFSTVDAEGSAERPVDSWNDCVRADLDEIGARYDWWRNAKTSKFGRILEKYCWQCT